MLDRIIAFCRKNSIPFDNGLLVLLHEARKALREPETEKVPIEPPPSPEIDRRFSSPEELTKPGEVAI